MDIDENKPIPIEENKKVELIVDDIEVYGIENIKQLIDFFNDDVPLEKTNIEINSFKRYTELFFLYALIAFVALALEQLLKLTIFRSIT
jgi:hypothetical protein